MLPDGVRASASRELDIEPDGQLQQDVERGDDLVQASTVQCEQLQHHRQGCSQAGLLQPVV